jgi:hypothetical protein
MTDTVDRQQPSNTLRQIQQGFGLPNARIGGLPPIHAIDFVEQRDSDQVTFNDLKTRAAHAFKLYIGNRKIGKKKLQGELRVSFSTGQVAVPNLRCGCLEGPLLACSRSNVLWIGKKSSVSLQRI